MNMNSTLLAFFGWGSFVLFALMQVPQIIKTMKTKDVSGISEWTSIFYTLALLMSCVYLYMFNDLKPWPVIYNQAFSSILSATQVILFFKYKK